MKYPFSKMLPGQGLEPIIINDNSAYKYSLSELPSLQKSTFVSQSPFKSKKVHKCHPHIQTANDFSPEYGKKWPSQYPRYIHI